LHSDRDNSIKHPIVAELEKEPDRLGRAIAVLKNATRQPIRGKALLGTAKAPQRDAARLAAAGRKRLSELIKKRWVERRRMARVFLAGPLTAVHGIAITAVGLEL
jgi:hypothetical protein